MSIATEAEKLIHGERRDDYGPMKESFKKIARIWTAILKNRYPSTSHYLTFEDVAIMMIGLKLCRETTKHKRDNLIDICGYTLCLSEMHGDDKENN